MQALPTPRLGGDINELKKHLNLSDDDAFMLAVGWLLSAREGHDRRRLITIEKVDHVPQ